MKVYIITNNVNRVPSPPGGGDPLDAYRAPGSPKYFCFYFFLLRCIGSCASFVQLFATFSRKSVT